MEKERPQELRPYKFRRRISHHWKHLFISLCKFVLECLFNDFCQLIVAWLTRSFFYFISRRCFRVCTFISFILFNFITYSKCCWLVEFLSDTCKSSWVLNITGNALLSPRFCFRINCGLRHFSKFINSFPMLGCCVFASSFTFTAELNSIKVILLSSLLH